MIPSDYFPVVIWSISLIQILGIGSVFLARLTEGSRWQTACRVLFFASLTTVGVTAVVTMLFSTELWLLSGMTLSGMVVSALFEREDPEHISVW